MRSRFDDQMQKLNADLIIMGRTVAKAISAATASLVSRDKSMLKTVQSLEQEIDELERDIESLCYKLLLQQQPIARDLRMVSAALKMVTDMERIGDQSVDIAEIAAIIANEGFIMETDLISKMGEAGIEMVDAAIAAFVKNDRDLAQDVILCDDRVDTMFAEIKDKLYDLMVSDAQNCRQALDLLMIAKYYERIADHAVNIAEWVIFSITGEAKQEVHSHI
ncbi:MAG: phosphate signaling complex protein PhoU [Defluviitaleaceae bacterium]|nr:phosphate signaling complex protein PhoU [Defluviitaleaceae bacterium]